MDQDSTELTNFIFYTAPNGDIKLEVLVQDETIWLTQKMMGELFGVSGSSISEHLNNIYKSGELVKAITLRDFRTVRKEGDKEVERFLDYYNLDAIISVGYRVNSTRATQFRIWATQILKEYIIKGFVMNDERLKQGKTTFGQDYFQELLERIRSIRASERRIYQQITDIFAECCTDYDPNSSMTKDFFAMIQNKFHYAITGQTAAEIISTHADSKKPYMGLKTWKHSPDGRIIESDVKIAKNYLSEKEIKKLERTVSSFFDYIEGLIERKNTFTMGQFAESVNKFLGFNEYKILETKGKISMKNALSKATKEYKIFNKTQVIESDFDKEMKKQLGNMGFNLS